MEENRPWLLHQSWKAYFATLGASIATAWGLLQMRHHDDQLVRDIAYAGVIAACTFALVMIIIMVLRVSVDYWRPSPPTADPVKAAGNAKIRVVLGDNKKDGQQALAAARNTLRNRAAEAEEYARGKCRVADWNAWSKRAALSFSTGFRTHVEEEYREALRGDAGDNCELYFGRAANFLRAKADGLAHGDLKPDGRPL